MVRFVLVHGAWLGAWCWDQVSSALRASGHELVARDLPGPGNDATPVQAISLESYVDTVARVVRSGSEKPVVIGHSMTGIVISSLAERMPEAISSLIYVAAYLLQPGESIVTTSQIASDSLVGPNMVPAADCSTISIKPEVIREVFAADAPETAAQRLQSLARPEPAAPFNTPVAVTSGKFGSVARSSVKTTEDCAVTPRLQDAMLAKTPCAQVLTLNTRHTPFLPAPSELARTLEHLAAGEKGAGA
jgi:pimeloyl-ACP methyl ester carboxylesterase